MAIKAVNDTAGPNRLVSTLLVYGAYPRISNLDPPALSVTHRAAVIRKAMAEIVKLQAKQAVNSALHRRNRPDITLVHNLPLNSEVLI
jgi:thioester reductase-like protein